jgi:DNA helicase-2/ATP-dependent DNA helicase PcrA
VTPLDLSTLTAEQQDVVTHPDGPAVVIACPGSGKTRALTHRMAWLIQERHVAPRQILGITFTKAATREMKERVQALEPAHGAQVRLFTFHGLAWRIVTTLRGAPNVLDKPKQHAMFRQILKELEVNADQTTVEAVETDIACFVGGLFPRERFTPASLEPDLFFRLWDEYTRLKAEAGCSDFDDLIIQARDLLTRFPHHREAQAGSIRHLLVDEFQDTNALQWEFLQLMLPPTRNLMVVGDDDQAIYGWRGASPSFMLNFREAYPDAQLFHLSRNFRSVQSLFAPAVQLISRNTVRFPKQLEAERPAAQAPVFSRPRNSAEEADQVAESLKAHLMAGGNPEEAAVLYRTGMIAFPLISRLEKAGIPFRILGGRPNPFTRWMGRDVLAYIRWALGEASLEEIVRVLRRPSRYGIAKELVLDLERAGIAPTEALTWLEQAAPPQGLRDVRVLSDHLEALRQLPAPKVITYIRQEIGYDRYIDQYCEWSGSDPREAREVLSALEQIPEAHEDARAYLALAAREAQQDADTEEAPDKITLSSLHGAKGLEWERVWLLSAVEGALPHRYTIESGREAAMEEERRLFYVGMTRAKDMLTVSAPAYMLGQDAPISRFVR